jgi:hypothetical protein
LLTEGAKVGGNVALVALMDEGGNVAFVTEVGANEGGIVALVSFMVANEGWSVAFVSKLGAKEGERVKLVSLMGGSEIGDEGAVDGESGALFDADADDGLLITVKYSATTTPTIIISKPPKITPSFSQLRFCCVVGPPCSGFDPLS